MPRKPMRDVKLDPIPRLIPSQLGPVPVFLKKKIKRGKDGRFVFGKYNTATREIHISRQLSHLMQWQTLFHEWAHMVMCDAGLHNLLTSDQQEVICDAFGTARIAELREAERAEQDVPT